MLVSGRGIVLGFVKYGDTSVIARIFTQDHGLCSFIIQGVYRKKARISASMLQSFSLLEMVYYFKENRQIHKIKEVRPSPQLSGIQTNIIKSSLAIFACEVLQNILSNTERDSYLFDWLNSTAIELNNKESSFTYWPHQFILAMAQLQGFAPEDKITGRFFHLKEGVFTNIPLSANETMNAEETQLLIQILNDIADNHASKVLRNEVLNKLIDYLGYHVGGFRPLKSIDVIRNVIS